MHKDKDPETSLERTYQPLRLADETCPECHGYGYAVLDCDGLEHPPAELQAVDACRCLEGRVLLWPQERLADRRDDLAAVLFVQDLQAGRAYAIDCAAQLIEATAPEPDAETTAEPDAPTFDVYRSETDGAWVVHVQTADMDCNAEGPFPLRVYINDDDDGPIYANPELPADKGEFLDLIQEAAR